MKLFLTGLISVLSMSAISQAQIAKSNSTTFCFLDQQYKVGQLTVTLSKEYGTQVLFKSVPPGPNFGGQSYYRANNLVKDNRTGKIKTITHNQLTYKGKGDLFDFGIEVNERAVSLKFFNQTGELIGSTAYPRQKCWDSTPNGVKH